MLSKARADLAAGVPISIGGADRTLRLSLDAMAWIEEHTPANKQQQPWALFRTLLTGLLLTGDPTLTTRRVGAWIQPGMDGMSELSAAIREALRLALPDEPGKPAKERTSWYPLWAVARHDLQITDEEFWSLTPRTLLLLLDRRHEAMEYQLYGHALTCSVLANVNRDPDKRDDPFTPRDFLPSLKEAAAAEPTDEERKKRVGELRAKAAVIAAAFGVRPPE